MSTAVQGRGGQHPTALTCGAASSFQTPSHCRGASAAPSLIVGRAMSIASYAARSPRTYRCRHPTRYETAINLKADRGAVARRRGNGKATGAKKLWVWCDYVGIKLKCGLKAPI
jgi:hypothetical protein